MSTTTTLHCRLHEYGTIHGREHISGTHHLEQTNIKEEVKIRAREHDYNIISATNIKHDNNNRSDLGREVEGADREREGVSEEVAGGRGRRR